FDKLVNVGLKDGQRIDLVDIEAIQKGITSSYDIEHLLSQSEAQAEDGQEVAHQIGNLIVIPKQINGIMSNATFTQKMDMLKQPWAYNNNIKNVPTYLQEFVAEYGALTWDEAAIQARTAKVAKDVYEAAAFKSGYA
ncbi:MAG: HNH endonuclease family protein, partial [Hyphomonadaceae bacterium]|nr:HNH endonuclease family protein [Hyphomonadaceae bacterium]